VAVEAEDILDAIRAAVEEERRAKISAARTAAVDVVAMALEMGAIATNVGELVGSALDGGEAEMAELIPPSKSDREARTKVAAAFNTNSRYVSDAKRLKADNPSKDICSRSPALRAGLVQQPVQIVASHDLTLFVRVQG